MTDQQAEGRPGRYERTISGGIGSMIVLVLAVLAFAFFRGAFRDNDAVELEPIDYLSVVGPAQEAGFAIVYPPSLPSGWKVTSLDYDRGTRPAWGIGMLTGQGKFVGLRQEDADLDSLLEDHVDDQATEGDTVTVEGALVPEWQEWSDDEGDLAYSATVGDDQVLVWGSAPAEDLLAVVRSLTDAPAD